LIVRKQIIVLFAPSAGDCLHFSLCMFCCTSIRLYCAAKLCVSAVCKKLFDAV